MLELLNNGPPACGSGVTQKGLGTPTGKNSELWVDRVGQLKFENHSPQENCPVGGQACMGLSPSQGGFSTECPQAM